ncbi:rod shape-determining protein RodA [Candidatus Microgenomates bacterium]|nr:rod shape-determining protein RodA [Candidatus Microgenomates bacterium]
MSVTKLKKRLPRLDWILTGSTLLLLSLGLMILFAINFKDPSLAQDFSPWQQLIYAVIGVGLMGLLARVDYRQWRRFGKFWYLAGIGLLILVLAIGKTALGATRAIDLGIFQFQPSEFMKLGLIMALAIYLGRQAEQLRRWPKLLLSMVLVAVPIALIAIQPDFGSAMVALFIWAAMVWVSPASKKQLTVLLVAALVMVPLVAANLQPYQRERLTTFLNPETDPRGAGYNVVQSTIAVGSGGLWGKGLGSGTQSQLNFLPSQHTDFVFAVLAEKLGFLGAALAIILFGLLIWRVLAIAWHSGELFGLLLGMGIAGFLLIHVVVNIGMNLGVLPVTGIPLPLLSYGGTNLIITLMSVGVMLSIYRHRTTLEFKS